MSTKGAILSTTATLQPKLRRRESIVADLSLIARVERIAEKRNIATRTKTLQFLTEYFEDSQNTKSSLPVATFDSVTSSHGEQGPPIVISGIPSSGKSFTLDLFLKECRKRKQPFLLFSSRAKDPKSTEHAWIPSTLSYYEFPTLKWLESPGEYRVELETDLNLRRQEVRDAAQTILRLEGDERLAKWIIAVEEAADYYDVKAFCTFLRRMRKSTRRILIVSTEAELFRMCLPMRPMPYD